MNKTLTTVLTMGLALGLGACGSSEDDNNDGYYRGDYPSWWNQYPGNPTPPNFNWNQYYGQSPIFSPFQSRVDYLQSTFGNVQLITPVTVENSIGQDLAFLPTGTYTWHQLFTMLAPLANACGCLRDGGQSSNSIDIWANIRYDSFFSFYGGFSNSLRSSRVRLLGNNSPSYEVTFQFVLDALLGQMYYYQYNYYSYFYWMPFQQIPVIWSSFLVPQRQTALGISANFLTGGGTYVGVDFNFYRFR